MYCVQFIDEIGELPVWKMDCTYADEHPVNRTLLLYIAVPSVYIPPAYLPLDEQFLKTTSFILKPASFEIMYTAAVVVLIDSNIHSVMLVGSLSVGQDAKRRKSMENKSEWETSWMRSLPMPFSV